MKIRFWIGVQDVLNNLYVLDFLLYTSRISSINLKLTKHVFFLIYYGYT